MSNFAALIATIQANIKTNGNEEITGAVLQDVLEAMVDALGTEAINNLETALSDEETARQNADGTLQDNIDAETLRAGTAEAGLDNRLDTIEGEIPSAASSSNKLADKAYVDEADTALGNAIGAIEDAIENGYVYAGIATPSGTPASGKVFYLAVTAGTYTNYGALVVTQGINILKNNGTAWSQEQLIALDNTPTPSSSGLVKSGGVFEEIMTNGSAFDLTVHNSGTTYADLSAALTAMDSMPAAYKKGGMSIKFVQTSDNKYVQYRLMTDEWSTTESDWQGIDDEPTAGNENLVKSGGVVDYGKTVTMPQTINRDNIALGIQNNVKNGSALSKTTIPSSYISLPGGVPVIATLTEDFWVDVYDVSAYHEKYIVLAGKCGLNVNTSIYGFSWDSSSLIDTKMDFYPIPSGQRTIYNLLFIPNDANYLFLGGATSFGQNGLQAYQYNGLIDIDNTPTNGSTSLVRSGGVVDYGKSNIMPLTINHESFAGGAQLNIQIGNVLSKTTIPSSYISLPYGVPTIAPLTADYWVDVYNVSSYRGKFIIIKGKCGLGVNSAIYGFSGDNSDQIDGSMDFYPIPSGERNVSNLLFIPDDATYLFLGCGTGFNLDSLQAYEFAGFSNNVIYDKSIIAPSSTLNRKYIPNNVVSDIESDDFKVDIYDVSDYKGKDLIIDGMMNLGVNTTIYTFSTVSSSIDSSSGYVKKNLIEFDNAIIHVPNDANYLFVERVERAQGRDYPKLSPRIYEPLYKSLDDNNLEITEKIGSIHEYRIMDCDVLICPMYGQSLAVAGEAHPRITTSLKYPELQVGIDMQPMVIRGVEQDQEYAENGMSESVIKFFAEYYGISVSQIKTKVCAFCRGAVGQPISNLKKGTTAYANLISAITTAYNNATALGLSCKVAPIAWIQGESDIDLETSTYKNDVIQLQSDLDADIKAVTHQTEDVLMMLYQTAWEENQVYSYVRKAQYELIRDNNKFLALTPMYIMDYYHTTPDDIYIHINGWSQKLLGYYCGKTIVSYLKGFNSKGITVQSVWTGGMLISLTLSAPSNALYIDTNYVKGIDKYGFSVVNGLGNEILESVEVGCDNIRLICSENVTAGCKVRYALLNGTSTTGRNSGARGNIRDNSLMMYAECREYRIPLYNWLFAFELEIS